MPLLNSWQGWRDLNPRHPVLETGALPLSYTPMANGSNYTFYSGLLLLSAPV